MPKTIATAPQSLTSERIKNDKYHLRLKSELSQIGFTSKDNVDKFCDCDFQTVGITYDAKILNSDWEEELFSPLYKAWAYTYMFIHFDEEGNPYKSYSLCIQHDSGRETYKMDLTEVQATSMFMNFLKKHGF